MKYSHNHHTLNTVLEELKAKKFDVPNLGSVVVLVKNMDDKYLVIQRAANDEDGPSLWDFAGGSCDTHDVHENACRELYEETGLQAEVLTFLEHSTYICPWKGEEKVRFVFLHETDEDFNLSFEHDDGKWIETHEVHDFNFYKQGFIDLFKKQSHAIANKLHIHGREKVKA
jgi:8-oxo-dGTP pyrophosphatase MutT (NUDIX family)